MSITLDQIIQDAKRVANRFKDLEALGNALLVEAEGNNRQIETMKQFQDDIDSLNKLARNKTNVEMVNRVNQQNPSLREFRQENRELKATLEDHQRALELIMHKYREQVQHKVFTSRINFKEIYNAKLQDVIHKQQEKINEMVAVMQKAASVDDDIINNEIELITRLKIENQGLRELLQISKQFGTSRIGCEDKSIQTEFLLSVDDNFDSYKMINDNYNDNNKSKIVTTPVKNHNDNEISKDIPSQMEYDNNEIIGNAMKMTKSTETVKRLSLSSSSITQQTTAAAAAVTTTTAKIPTTTIISPSSTTLSKTTTEDNNKLEINFENEPKNKSSIAETTTATSVSASDKTTVTVEPIKTVEDSAVNVTTKLSTPTTSSPSPSSTTSLLVLSEINSISIMNGESGDCNKSAAQEQVS